MTRVRKSLSGSVAAELVAIVVIAVGAALIIQAWVVKPYKVPSASMEPTLKVGERIFADRIGMHFESPKVGDIMVFHPPVDIDSCNSAGQSESTPGQPRACDSVGRQESGVTFVKRVVGLPGDHLQIINGQVIRNGRAEPDAYAVKCPNDDPDCDFPGTIVVPQGDYYMMGDNRPDSEDSRFWGPVPKSWLIGYIFAGYWPLDRIGVI